MTRAFISHSSIDRARAATVAAWLEARPEVEVFFSPDPDDGIPGGVDWDQYLHLQLKSAEAVVLVNSEHARASPWVAAELAIARSLGTPILPLAPGGEPAHPVVERVQSIPWDDDDTAREALTRRIVSLALAADSRPWDPKRGPFPGMHPFSAADAGVFFGREDLQAELLRRLRRPVTRGIDQVVMVVGASGSGKSSLVRAGVVPHLAAEGRWIVVGSVRPRLDPVGALAAALADAVRDAGIAGDWDDYAHAEAARQALRRDAAGLGRVVSALAATVGDGDGAVLIVLDQAEELLAKPLPDAHRDHFAALVTGLLGADRPLRVLATLRSEFLDEALESLALRKFVGQTVNVPPLDAEGMRAAIVRPARRAAIGVEDDLVEALVAEAEQPGSLPLIAHLLRRLWEDAVARQGADGIVTLTADAYERLGGVGGVVRQEAEKALAALTAQGAGDEVLPTLLEFVDIAPGGEWTRTQVRRSELSGARELVVEQFLELNLLVTDVVGDAEDPVPIVEVAHETLFTAWPALQRAIEDDADVIRTRNRLRRNAAEWADAHAEPPVGAELEATLYAVGYRGRGYGRRARRWVTAEEGRLGEQSAAYLRQGLRLRRRRGALLTTSALLGLAAAVALTVFLVDRWRDRDRRIDATAAVAQFPAGGAVPLGPELEPVDVGPFGIEVNEVTVRRYRKCVAAGACAPPQRPGVEIAASALPEGSRDATTLGELGVAVVPLGEEGQEGQGELYFASHDAAVAQDLPVTFVDSAQAARFCAWIGRRLPTWPEWVWAARAGPELHTWPWGDEPPAGRVHVDLGEQGVVAVRDRRFDDGAVAGVTHLIGNVWEWTSTLEGGETWDGEAEVTGLRIAGIGWTERLGDWSGAATAETLQDARTGDRDVGFRCLVEGEVG